MRIYKRLFGRKPNGGFTLAEMVVSCALLGILAVGITAFVAPVLRSAAEVKVNARASLLAETIEGYIRRSTVNSCYVKIFTNVDSEDVKSGGVVTTNEDLIEMRKFFDKDDNSKIYDFRCIGICWDSVENKYILKNETLSTHSGALDLQTESYDVFENCFYKHLYPVVTFEQLSAEVTKTDESGNEVTTTEKVGAMKTTVTVYTTQDTSGLFTFQGVGYTDYINIRNPNINPTGVYKFYEIEALHESDGVSVTYPQTYIYFITRKPSYTKSESKETTETSETS